MPSCAFIQCTNHSRRKNKTHGITFHAFPKDELLKHKWLVVVRNQRREHDWLPTVHSRICSIHFRPGDLYNTNKGLTRIIKGAVPYFQAAMKSSSYTCSRPGSPNSLHNEDISDLNSVFDSPRKSYLKSEIRKVLNAKKKLIKDNKNLKRKNKRLTEKCKSLKECVLRLKKVISLGEDQFQELCSKAEAADLFSRMKQQKKKNQKLRIAYSPALRKFALTVYFYSPAAYKYVRKTFEYSLPHPRTLGKWYENFDAKPGFTAEAFNVLKKKSSASGTKLLCSLVMDEMAIRQQTIWNTRKTLGLVNYGNGSLEVDKVATQAFVMMVVSLNENWKLPVGYFFVNGLTAEQKANLVNICLTKCLDAGVNIVALIFDGCRSNVNAANILGCNLEDVQNLKTTFKHPSCDTNVAVFLDPCHMVKLVRNTFESKRLIIDDKGREIKWQFLINLLKLQSSQTLTFANKLTPRHIDFRNQIMKVKLATQLLSKSVATSLKLCGEMLSSSNFSETEATVEFIENFNNLFDIMNSRKRDRFGFKKPICPDNKKDFFAFLDKLKEYICSLKIYVKRRRISRRRHSVKMTIGQRKLVLSVCKTGFLGFIICIESLKYLYSTLVETNTLKYIATYRLSQDHLELLFGVFRRQGGYNNNPNTQQFQGIYKRVLGHLELRSSLTGNCIPLDNFPILTCSSAVDSINRTIARNLIDLDNYDEQDNLLITELYDGESFKKHKVTRGGSNTRVRDIKKNLVLQSDITAEQNVEILNKMLNNNDRGFYDADEQIIGYIAGWVARALIKIIKCEICLSELITNEKLAFHKLISLKDMGGLCYPSYDLYEICKKTEKHIKLVINKNQTSHFVSENQILQLKINTIKSFVNSNILSTLEIHSLEQPVTFNHRTHLLRAIIDKYCNVRLHYLHKIDPAISKTTKRQKRNKLSLFEGV